MLSIMEGGSVLTDSRVISYQTQEDEVLSWSAKFGEITDIYVELEGSLFADTQLMVETSEGFGFLLYLSTEDGGDQNFINRLRKKMKKAGPRGQQVRKLKGTPPSSAFALRLS